MIEMGRGGRPRLADTRDWGQMTVPELKEVLRARGLRVGGRKAELIARLQAQ